MLKIQEPLKLKKIKRKVTLISNRNILRLKIQKKNLKMKAFSNRIQIFKLKKSKFKKR